MTIKLFMKLFRGLTRGYGEKLADGTAVNRKESLTEEIYQAHLDGDIQIGVYCVKDNNTIHWACLDVDKEKNPNKDPGKILRETREKARKLYDRSRELGLTPIVEYSSSGVSMHLWFCFENPIPAWQGKMMLEDIKIIAGLGGDPKVEVFPKQTENKGGWGNFVYLPLHGKLKHERKTKIIRWGFTDTKGKDHGLGPLAKNAKIPTIAVNEIVSPKRDPKRKSSLEGRTAEEIFKICGVELEKARLKRGELWAICPNPEHRKDNQKEKTPSWSIDNKALVWHCFGCGKSGWIDKIVKWTTDKELEEFFEPEKKKDTAEYIENKLSITKIHKGNEIEIANFGFEITKTSINLDTDEEGEDRTIVFTKENTPPKEIEVPWEDLVDIRAFSRLTTKHRIGVFKGTSGDFLSLRGQKEDKLTGIPMGRIRNKFGFLPNGDFDTIRFSILKGKVHKAKAKFKMEKGILKSNFAPFSITTKSTNKTMGDLLGLFKRAYPDIPIEIALGWIFGAIYTIEIRKLPAHQAFPLLYLSGVAGSGKTCLARNLMGLWGSRQEMNLTGCTGEGGRASLERASHYPVSIDDVRRSQFQNQNAFFLSILRSLFDGSGGSKGTIKKGFIDQTTLTGCGLIVGEDLPDDDALQTRTILLTCPKTQFEADTKEAFQEITETLPELSRILLQKLCEKNPKEWAKIKESINACIKYYGKHFNQERQAFVWAVPTAAFCYFFDQIPDDDFMKKLIDQGKVAQRAREDEEPWIDFMEILNELIGPGSMYRTNLGQNTDYAFSKREEGIMLLKLKKAWRLWNDIRPQGNQIAFRKLIGYLDKKGIIQKITGRKEERYSILTSPSEGGKREYWYPIRITQVDREIIPDIYDQWEE